MYYQVNLKPTGDEEGSPPHIPSTLSSSSTSSTTTSTTSLLPKQLHTTGGDEGYTSHVISPSKPFSLKEVCTDKCASVFILCVLTLGLGAIMYGVDALINWKDAMNAKACINTYTAVPLEVGAIYSDKTQVILWNVNLIGGTWNCTTFTEPPLPLVVIGQQHTLYVNDNNDRCCAWQEGRVDCGTCGSEYQNTVLGFGFGAAFWCIAWIAVLCWTMYSYKCCGCQ